MARAGKNGKGPLAEELVRTLQDIAVGQPRREAYLALAERTGVQDLRRFIRAVVQADAYGVSIADVLRTQAQEMRLKRRQRAEEKAMQIPVKVIFPLILCILPTLFIVLLGPAAMDIVSVFSLKSRALREIAQSWPSASDGHHSAVVAGRGRRRQRGWAGLVGSPVGRRVDRRPGRGLRRPSSRRPAGGASGGAVGRRVAAGRLRARLQRRQPVLHRRHHLHAVAVRPFVAEQRLQAVGIQGADPRGSGRPGAGGRSRAAAASRSACSCGSWRHRRLPVAPDPTPGVSGAAGGAP